MESEFPSNSKLTKKETVKPKGEEKKVEKVTTGEVIKRKKSWGKRVREHLISGTDSKSVLEYVMFEILIPAAKDMFMDAANAGMQRKFYGEAHSSGRRNYGRTGGHTAYNRMGHPSRSSVNDLYGREDPRAPALSRRARATHDFGEIVLETRVDATEVIDTLYELLSKFDVVAVADLYDLVGINSSPQDLQWGWTDLSGSDVSRVRNGYLLILPRPEPID